MADELLTKQAVLDLTYKGGSLEGLIHAFKVENLNGVNALVLPCKVGDTLYSKDGKVAEIEEFHIDKNNVHMTVSFKCDYNCERCAFNTWRQEYSGEYSCEGEWGEMTIPADEIGKTVFLTREEAEKALEGREDNAN